MIRTSMLRRVYKSDNGGEVVALSDVTLNIGSGEVHGLLGPNGAGKTTLVRILSTALLPSDGTAEINGLDVVTHTKAVRREIGVVFGGDRGLYPKLTGRENLEYWASFFGFRGAPRRNRVDTLLARLGLKNKGDERVETYSRGMKQRLHLARGLVSDPKVLFLDEPTLGMDPIAADEFRNLIKDLRNDGKTILLATHDMSEAEALCSRVSLIDHGKIIITEGPQFLSSTLRGRDWIEFTPSEDMSLELFEQSAGVEAIEQRTAGSFSHRIQLRDGSYTNSILQGLLSSGVVEIRTVRPSLGDVYREIIGGRGFEV